MEKFKLLKFYAKYPWFTTEELEKTDTRTNIYATSDLLNRVRRYDAVIYKHYGVLMRGIVHMVIEGTPGSVNTVKIKILIICRLRQSAPVTKIEELAKNLTTNDTNIAYFIMDMVMYN